MSQMGFEAEVLREPYARLSMADVLRLERKNGFTAVGSFSGCGGSSLGLRMAGWDVPYAIEFIPAAADTYEANSKAFVDRRDIRKVDPLEILEYLDLEKGYLDLFEGSPPCASFSSAGKGEKGWGEVKKYSDSKQRTDDLFDEWLRVLEGLEPKTFVAENVAGMMNGRALEEYTQVITRRLSELGYHVRAKVLNACWYGVPQQRDRLIFVGIRRDVSDDPIEFPGATVDPPYTLREALEDVKDDDPADVAAASMEKFAVGRVWQATVDARKEGKEVRFEHLPCQRCGEPLTARTHEILKTSGAGVVTKAKCADGADAEILKEYFMLVVPDLDLPSPTVTATAGQVGAASITHPTENRKMTPAELLSVSGFPADFKLTGEWYQRVERMGRAVPPPMYAAVGRAIAEALR